MHPNAKAEKRHNSDKINPIFSKVNKVIYSSADRNSPSFKAKVRIVIKKSCSQEKPDERADG